MKRILFSTFLFLYLATIVSATMALQTSPAPAPGAKPDAQNSQVHLNGSKPTGEEVFKANCGRCHMPPMVVSPRITGTVVMHMRVRARLSRQDEQLLLKYMAP
jgi:hypothetical protein